MMTAAMCLAMVIYTEAGIEDDIGRAATGWSVIHSSEKHKIRHSICREAYSRMYAGINKYHQKKLPHGILWQRSVDTAHGILSGSIPDPTGGATNFECTRWKACVQNPGWAKDMDYLGIFGTQKFWRRQ